MAEELERNELMKALIAEGVRPASIARAYKISRERVRQIVGNTGTKGRPKRVSVYEGVCECSTDFHYPGFQDEFQELLNQFKRDGYTFYMEKSCNNFFGNDYEILGKTKHWKAVRYKANHLKQYFAR